MRAALEARGHKIKRSAGRFVTTCPAHEDKEPSLSFGEGDRSEIVVKCHAGCSFEQIVEALNLTQEGVTRSGVGDFESRIDATYDYVDETGELIFQAVRLKSPKSFRQRRMGGDGWTWSLGDARRVLYRLPAVREAAESGRAVFGVEGEKDVEALERLGFVATCSPMGAGKWRDEYTASLAGVPMFIAIADCDSVGRDHAKTAVESAHANGIPTKLIDLAPDRVDGYDVSDFITEHGENARKLLERLVKQTKRWPLSQGPALPIMSFGEFAAQIGDRDDSLDYLGAFLRGGKRVHVIGPIGHGKTTFLAEILSAAVNGRDLFGFKGRGDVRALYVELGDMAPEEIKETLVAARFDLDGDRFDLAHLPDGLEVDKNEQHRRMLEDAMARYEIVAIDPWYKLICEELSDGMRNVRTVTAFLDGFRERFPTTAVVIGFHANEPQKGQRIKGLGDASGYKAFQRGADTAVLFERLRGDRSHVTWAKTRSKHLPKMGERWLVEWRRGAGFQRVEREKPSDEAYEKLTDDWQDVYEIMDALGRENRRSVADLLDRLLHEGRAEKRKNGRRVEYRRANADQTSLTELAGG
jgi:hypothetical protein